MEEGGDLEGQMENVCDKEVRRFLCVVSWVLGNILWDQLSRAEGLLRLSFRRHSFKELGEAKRQQREKLTRDAGAAQGLSLYYQDFWNWTVFQSHPQTETLEVALFTMCRLDRLWPGARAWGRHQGAAFWSRLSGVSVPRSLSVCREACLHWDAAEPTRGLYTIWRTVTSVTLVS